MRFKMELFLAVEEYVEDGFSESEAFEQASTDTEAVSDLFKGICEDQQRTDVTLIESTFQEFDSSNWTHAMAYWLVEYEAEAPLDTLH